jgi:hypothetical protein
MLELVVFGKCPWQKFADSLIETFAKRFGFQVSAGQRLFVEYKGDIHAGRYTWLSGRR